MRCLYAAVAFDADTILLIMDSAVGSRPQPEEQSLDQQQAYQPPADQGDNSGPTTAFAAAQQVPPVVGTVDEAMQKLASYKEPAELLAAPPHGQVYIAGRRLDTGEVPDKEVIHLADYPADTGSSQAEGQAGKKNNRIMRPIM